MPAEGIVVVRIAEVGRRIAVVERRTGAVRRRSSLGSTCSEGDLSRKMLVATWEGLR